MLKDKIVITLILKHFDSDRDLVIVAYASKWVVSVSLLQEYDGVYWPVTLVSRTLKRNEIKYNMVEKEVLALLKRLMMWYFMVLSRYNKVITRHSTLDWLVKYSDIKGRLGEMGRGNVELVIGS